MGAKISCSKIDRSELEARDFYVFIARRIQLSGNGRTQSWTMPCFMESLWTVFGWEIHIHGNDLRESSIRNFPMQANGAEMLRLACILAIEAGVKVIAPVHDAILIEYPLDNAADHITSRAGRDGHMRLELY